MKDVSMYLGDVKLPVMPSRISFSLPTQSSRYELIGAGEIEILKGAKLAEIYIEGFFPASSDAEDPQYYIDAITKLVRDAEPFHFMYIGQKWDINMLCSMQTPSFSEVGACFDVDYKLALRRWTHFSTKISPNPQTRVRSDSILIAKNSSAASYTVKQGDNLSHIAKYTLGDSSRWRDIYELNQDQIKNPNLIYPGQNLILPDDHNSTISPIRIHSSSSTKRSSKSSSSRPKKSSSSKNKASNGANSNTLSPTSSSKRSSSKAKSADTKSSGSQTAKYSPAPKYSSAGDFYRAFSK